MARAVWKYPMAEIGSCRLSMPFDAKVILVDYQNGQLTLWAEVVPSRGKEGRVFVIHGTGHDITNDDEIHVHSWQNGQYVWHLYEEKY